MKLSLFYIVTVCTSQYLVSYFVPSPHFTSVIYFQPSNEMMLPDVMTVYKRGSMMRQGLGMNWYGPSMQKRFLF